MTFTMLFFIWKRTGEKISQKPQPNKGMERLLAQANDRVKSKLGVIDAESIFLAFAELNALEISIRSIVWCEEKNWIRISFVVN